MSLLPEEQVVEQAAPSLLPQQTEAPPPRVPRNIDEVASQIAMAMDDGLTFKERVAKHAATVQAGGKQALLAEVMLQEHEDQVIGAKAQVLAAVQARDARAAAAAAQETERIQNTPTTTNPVEQEKVAVERSLEAVAGEYVLRHKDLLDKERKEAAGDVVLRNIVNQELVKMGDVPLADMVTDFFGRVFLPRGYDIMGNKLINKITGGTNLINSYEAAVQFRNMALTMPPEKVREVVQWFIKQPSGFFGENLASKAKFLRNLTELTASEARAEIGLDAWQASDIALLFKGIATMARGGAPLAAVDRVGGQKAAGQLAAADLTGGTKMTGFNNAELVGKVLSAGHNPWEALDPAAVNGIGAKTFEKLKQDWDTMLGKVKETLSSTTATPEEIEKAGQIIRNSYMSNPNPHLHTVLFGELSDKGQSVVTVWQGKDGTRFLSKEMADAWAKERGMLHYEVVPREAAISRAEDLSGAVQINKQIGFHGGSAGDNAFKLARVGTGQGGSALGHGISSTAAEELAEKYAAKYGGKKAAVSTVDIPEDNRYINWYGGWSEQSAEVQKGIAKLDPKVAKEAAEGKMTGQDIYYAIRDGVAKGNEPAAAKMLDEAGVYGNMATRSGPHGTGPEHLTFNPERIVNKGSRAVDGVPKNKAKPLSQEDWELEMDKALAAGDQKRMDELDQIGYNFTPSETPRVSKDRYPSSRLSRAAAAKIEADDYVKRDNLTFDKNIPIETQRVLYKWSKMLGMKDDIRILNADKLYDLGLLHPELSAHLDSLAADLSNARGLHVVSRNMKGSVIIMNTDVIKDLKSIDYMTTLAHEFGHAFFFRTMNQMPKAAREELADAYRAFAKARTGDIDKYVREMRVVTKGTLKQRAELAEAGITTASETRRRAPEFFNWIAQYDEFFAEQFAKYMLTDVKPRTALERYFKELADKLRAFLTDVYKQLIKPQGDDNYIVPQKWFSDFMDEHIARVKSGEFVALDGDAAITQTERNIRYNKDIGDTTTTTKPHIRPKLNEWVVVEKQNVPLPYAALGKFSAKDIESAAWIAVDPKHGASELGVERRLVGVHAEAKTQKALVDYIAPYYKGVGKDGKNRIAALLEKGDSFSDDGVNYGREFSFMEAKAQGLSDVEATAYLATRSLRMAMYHIRNGELVRHLRAQGYREVELAGLGLKLPGRELSLESSVGYAGREVFDMSTNAPVRMTTKELEEAYANGKRLITVAKPVSIEKEGRSVFLADDTAIKVRDIHTALHYRPGEYSRIYTDEYFVKIRHKQKVDGEFKTYDETVRTAASQREADEFVAAFKSALAKGTGASDSELEQLIGKYMPIEDFKNALKNGEFDTMEDISSHYTRNRDEFLNGSVSEAMSSGRMFTSKRSNRIFSVDANRQNTLGVFESLQAEITNISRVANINEWRDSMIQRWMNTFGEMLPSRTGDDVADFYSAAGAKFTKGTEDALFAQRTHEYIMRQVGVKTDEEQFYAQFTRGLTERIFKGGEGIESVGAAIRQFSPLGFLRNINFNLTLGMFNPAQLIVQSNGAATAIMLSPVHGLGAAKTFPILRMALMSDNPQVWSWLAKVEKFTNLGLSDEKEFVELIKAVRKTGIIDNIRSTSLWNREEGRHNIFGGYPSKVIGSHTMFFNRGEEFSRLVAFDVARREFKAANPGMAWNSDDALKNILTRADDLTQNMTKANLARFQEGAVSLPLQFAQYNIKLAANIITAFAGKAEGRGFTRREAAQLMAGHVLMYGAAGNGLAMLYDELIPQETRDKMSVEAKTLLAQGLLSAIVAQVGEAMTGERTNLALGSRLGAFNYYQQLADSIFKDDKSVVEALMGPTAATGRRLGVIGDVAYLWYKNPNLETRDVLEGLGRMTTEQVATLRNASKAYLFHMHGNKFLDKRGQPMAQLSTPEILAQAIGIQPTAAVDVYNMLDSKKKHTEAIIGVAELIYQVQKDITVARAKGDHAYADKQQKLLQALYPENTGDFMEVQRHIREKLYPYDTAYQKLLGQYLYQGKTYEQPMIVTKEPKQ